MKGKGEIEGPESIIKKTLKIKIIIGLLVALGFLFLIVIIISMIASTFKPIIDIFSDDSDQNTNYNLSEEEDKFKKRVNEVYNEIKAEHSVSIDRAVLASTVLYSGDYDIIYDDEFDYDNAVENIFTEEKGFTSDIFGNIKNWLNENLFQNTVSSKQLKRYRTSKTYLKALALAQINGETKSIDLKEYEKYLADEVVASLYPDLVSKDNKKGQKRIAREIMNFAEIYYAYFGEEKKENCATATSCEYNVRGKTIKNLKVRLLHCQWSNPKQAPKPIEGEELVDFEKYILGVTYGEGDRGSASKPEKQKVQAIAARNFALTRPKQMGESYGIKFTEENGQWILSIRNCTADQVYCDPDKGCSTDSGKTSDSVFSGANIRTKTYKPPLPQDDSLRKTVAETAGKILIDTSGNIVETDFKSGAQNSWEDLAKLGWDHTEILMNHYKGKNPSGIQKGNCSSSMGDTSCTNTVTGPFTSWKQCDPSWGNVKLGSSNICKIGCLATSVAMQIAASGIPTGMDNFNPGTFVEKGKKSGLFTGGNMIQNNVSKVVPGFSLIRLVSVCGMSKKEKIATAQQMINEQCYIVMEVKGANSCGKSRGQHWVAVSGVTNDDISMWDPASQSTEVFKKYGNNGAMMNCYKKS